MQSAENFPNIDTETASVARGYGYMLGDDHNYEVDRRAAHAIEEMFPGTFALSRNNRRYLERLVRYLAEHCGIRQFIDHGSGLPTQNNVHQVAQSVAPDARVVYVDSDPTVLRSQQIEALPAENSAFILEDVRDIDTILNHPDTRRLIDFTQPVAALYISFLHCIPDEDDPVGIVRRTVDRLSSGSYLAISHLVSDSAEVRTKITDFIVAATGGNWGRVRQEEDVRAVFDGMELVDPGLVEVTTWRPDGREEEQTFEWMEFGGVARKP